MFGLAPALSDMFDTIAELNAANGTFGFVGFVGMLVGVEIGFEADGGGAVLLDTTGASDLLDDV